MRTLMQALGHGILSRCTILAIVAIGLSGCSRYRPFERVARRPAILPTTPITRERPRVEPELPVTLPPADSYSGSRVASSYGPPAGVSVAPLGSTGFSRDIRHRQFLAPRPEPMPMTPPANATARLRTVPRSESKKDELPITLPAKPKQNGNGSPRADSPRDSTAGPNQEQATGIPGFAVVDSNIATGGQPTLEGMKWLKERGFHTVVNLLPAGEADAAEASMVRELGLDYVSLPITAQSIGSDTLDQFNQIADDATNRPLFIHDSTGSRTGAMWYLHRVIVDNVPEDRARHQASRMGLKDTDTELWLAIQRVLEEKK